MSRSSALLIQPAPKPGLVVADVSVVFYAGLAGLQRPCPPAPSIAPRVSWRGILPVKEDEAGSSLVEEAEVTRPGHRLIAGGGAELAVDRVRLRFDGVGGQEHLCGDLGER